MLAGGLKTTETSTLITAHEPAQAPGLPNSRLSGRDRRDSKLCNGTGCAKINGKHGSTIVSGWGWLNQTADWKTHHHQEKITRDKVKRSWRIEFKAINSRKPWIT